MLILFIYLQLNIHKSHDYLNQPNIKNTTILSKYEKTNPIKSKIDLKSDFCQNISNQIGTSDGWLNNGVVTEYLIDCNHQTIHISGSGIYMVKNNRYNTLPKGLINIIDADFECSMTKIYASGSASEKTQLINLEGIGNHSIIDTNFEFCGVYPYSYSVTDWDPSIIFISGESTNFISSAKFINPDTNNPNPQEICQTRTIRTEGNCSIKIINCVFYNSSCYTKGSFLWLSDTNNISISYCNFEECISIINEAHAIFITGNNAEIATIDNCNFVDCGKNNQGYIIQSEISNFLFSDNTIIFSNTNCSGCILCNGKGEYDFENNYFTKCKDPIKLSHSIAKSEIINNTFIECSAYSYGGSINVYSPLSVIHIYFNNFTRCIANEGLSIYINAAESVEIQYCNFTDNYINSVFAYTIYSKSDVLLFSDSIIEYNDNYQGSGIKIDSLCSATICNIEFRNFHQPSAIYYDIDEISEHEITVSGCLFIGSRITRISFSDIQYSAFQFGDKLNVRFYNNTIENYEISISYWPNLYIGKINNIIENCRFINNTVHGIDTGGTGLFLTGEKVQIINCYFYSNKAISKDNEIGGKGGCFHFNNSIIEIKNCSFINNKADFEGGALSIECISSYIHNTTFINNQAALNTAINNNNRLMGGAIYFKTQKINGDVIYSISNCIFKENKGYENGHAIYVAWTSTKVIISEPCVFEDNSKNNKGSQIFINENSSIEISNSTFQIINPNQSKSRGIELSEGTLYVHHSKFTNLEDPNESSIKEGNGILVNKFQNIANIEDNQFIDCYFEDQFSFIVTFNGENLDLFRNLFNFSPNKGCGYLRIYTSGNIKVQDNIFQNANTPANFNGVFIYEEKEIASSENINIIRNNLFDNCISQFTTCFNFKWISHALNYEFFNNTLQNNDSIDRHGEINFMGKLNDGIFYFRGNNFINNTSRGVYGGGSGLLFKNNQDNNFLYENHFTIVIDKSNFIGNHEVEYESDYYRHFRNGNGGAIQIGWTEELSNVDIEILNTNFTHNFSDRQGGAINFQVIGYIIINNCTFDENIAGQMTTDPLRIYGGAIYIYCDFSWDDGHYPSSNDGKWRYSSSITINGSTFTKNYAVNGLSIYIEESEYTNLYINNCHFIDNINHEYSNYSIIYSTKEFCFENSTIMFTDITKSSAAIQITRPTKIISCHFVNNSIHDENSAQALICENEAKDIEISNSTFENCGRGGNNYASLRINSTNVKIHNNIFNFTSNNQKYSCLPILVLNYCNINLYGNKISNSYCNGAFQYNPISNGNVSNENILIEKCIFEGCQGQDTRAFSIKLSSDKFSFFNNTIQDCSATGSSTSGGYLFNLDFQLIEITEFIINHFIFRNLTTDSDFGGGIGCKIQYNKRYYLIFKDCIFEDNYAIFSKSSSGCDNGKGGAFQFGWSQTFSNIILEVNKCIFIGNKSDQEGGAICMMIQGNIFIFDCEFINNRAGLAQTGEHYGGAISITSNYSYQQVQVSDHIIIGNCSFIGNVGHDANSIYVNKSPQTDLRIYNDCIFIDNITNSDSHFTVISDSRMFEIQDSSFEFSSISILSGDEQSSHTYRIYNCQFQKSGSSGAIQHSQASNLFESFFLSNCTFQNCLCTNKSCLSFNFLVDIIFEFKNNTFLYTEKIICSNYLYSFSFKNKNSLVIENISFINVECESLYGGGTGCLITGIYKIIFENCIFYNNTAKQIKYGETRPNQINKTTQYYNGDGGGLQYGYSELTYNTEIEIRKCTFQNNKATRHGGGIAFQTTRSVIVVDCKFEENVANNHLLESGTNLLFENYFDLKSEGRGGAIYINPTFSHLKKTDESFMTKIEIINSTFKSNSAFDGCAIYIEGDDGGTEFIIQQNTFIDNHYKNENPKSVLKGIVTSEIYNLYDGKIETSNTFNYTDPIIVKVLYVDHY